MKQQMQQDELKALAERVLERSECNTPCNNTATSTKSQCNFQGKKRGQKLHSVAAKIIAVSLELGIRPEIGLGFFTALDWKQLADGELNSTALRLSVEYAEEIQKQIRAGVRVVDVSNNRRKTSE